MLDPRVVVRIVQVAAVVGVGSLGFAALAFASGAEVQINGSATANVRPGGSVSIGLICAKGAATKSATVDTPALGGPSEKLTKKGNGFTDEFTVPAGTPPQTLQLKFACSDGSSTTASLTVAPAGAVGTGDGATSTGPSIVLLGVGGGLLAVAALGGSGLMVERRRRSSPSSR